MPIAAFFVTLFSSLTAGLIAMFGRKVVVATAAISAAVLLLVSFLAFMKGMLTTLFASLSLPVWASVLMWFIPDNFVLCMSTIIGANIGRAAYDFGMGKIRLVTSAV